MSMVLHDTTNSGFICSECGFASPGRKNVFFHVESKHLDSSGGYKCPTCFKFCKTMKALSIHNSRFHKVEKVRCLLGV